MERDPGEAGQETWVCLFGTFWSELVVFFVCLLFSEAILHVLMFAYPYPHKILRFYNPPWLPLLLV